MSGTTGPESDPGIKAAIEAIDGYMPSGKLRAALYAAIEDWHRREMEASKPFAWMPRINEEEQD